MIIKAVHQAKGNTMKKIMNATTTTLALLVAATLGGCSSTPKDAGKPFVQNPKESVALNVAAYAGYPYILRDNGYSKGLDTLATSGVHIPADHEHQFRFNVNTISGPM